MVNTVNLDQILIDNMKQGNEVDIVKGLSHSGALLRINAIINVVRHKLDKTAIVKRLVEMKDDNVIVSGYVVSDFAIAALHLLENEEYKGNNQRVNKLILSKFDFYG